MSAGRRRLDAHLVTAGLARSRGLARELIDGGHVRIDGRVVTRASTLVSDREHVEVDRHERYVGRAAHKLLGALHIFGDAFTPRIANARCLDLGASTGGFTQVLLEHGAASVLALDVGHGQLAELVREDPRVTNLEGTNVRDVRPGQLGERFDLIVGDLSFISLAYVIPVIAEQLAPQGRSIMLVKPQFEVGRGRLSKGGLVRSQADRQSALANVLRVGLDHGLTPVTCAVSPLPGGSGNREYLVLWKHSADEDTGSASERAIAATIDRCLAALDEGTE